MVRPESIDYQSALARKNMSHARSRLVREERSRGETGKTGSPSATGNKGDTGRGNKKRDRIVTKDVNKQEGKKKERTEPKSRPKAGPDASLLQQTPWCRKTDVGGWGTKKLRFKSRRGAQVGEKKAVIVCCAERERKKKTTRKSGGRGKWVRQGRPRQGVSNGNCRSELSGPRD